ncbi:ATP-binding protein [Glycomyces buryatensis]|uniref:ATP-binding protein n=1 Tax=Glycomyces buryatensis TaxID=2570927 RepID=UPI001B3C1653|nr:ATP-binding protein [Glycomyces buryatensis]
MPEQTRTTTQTYQAEWPPHQTGSNSSNAPSHTPNRAPGSTQGGDSAAELRPRLMRLALLPVVAVAVIGAGVTVFFSLAPTAPSWGPLAVFGSSVVLVVVIGYFAVHNAGKIDDDLGRKVSGIRRSTTETHYKVWQIIDDLQRGLPPDQRRFIPMPSGADAAGGSGSSDSTETALRRLGVAARELRAAAEAIASRSFPAQAPAAATQNGQSRPPTALPAGPAMPAGANGVSASIGSEPGAPADIAGKVPNPAPTLPNLDEPRVGIFVNRARRLQTLAHREIVELDELERQVEDPALLKALFSIDHLATRVRRHAENLAVLGGGPSHRQWSRPVNLYEALRSSIAEVEQYARVKLVRPIEGTIQGHAVADFVHLVAELIENATMFSEPNTQVLIRASRVRSGLAVEVEDRGLGMGQEEREHYNRMLSSPETIDFDELLADGRIGLYVVSMLARRHGLTVQLQSNIYGGTQAVVVIGPDVLGDSVKIDATEDEGESARSAHSGDPKEIPLEPPRPRGTESTPAPVQTQPPVAAPEPDPTTTPVRRPAGPATQVPSVQLGQPPRSAPPGQHATRPRPMAGSGHGPSNGFAPGNTGAIPVPRPGPEPGAPPGPIAPIAPSPTPPALTAGPPTEEFDAFAEDFDPFGASPPPGAHSAPEHPDYWSGDRSSDRSAEQYPDQYFDRPPESRPEARPDDRPPLPKRTRQAHLAPQLRDEAQSRVTSEVGHDPGLMSAFRKGRTRGDTPEDQTIPEIESSVTPNNDEEA